MTETDLRVPPSWLDLREAADGRARSLELVARLRTGRCTQGHVVHDLGAGSGSMGRWLSRLLDGPQRWVLHDRDADLLELAAGQPSPGIRIENRTGDVTRLRPEDLGGATLVTASALLDLLTWAELDQVVCCCAHVGAPVLFSLSVTGQVHLDPVESLDAALRAGFNDHQRRVTPRGRLLGPDAAAAADDLFRRHGWQVESRRTPWRLSADCADLTREWLRGWVGAALEQRPELSRFAQEYAALRMRQLADGQLRISVGHLDLLATARERAAGIPIERCRRPQTDPGEGHG